MIETGSVAALYVDPRGCYANLPGVEAWGEDRDARTYGGPWPVVAHPPCQRWGKFATGAPNKPRQYQVGDDAGCFAAALKVLYRFGGVIEHPAHSKAWVAFHLNRPPADGGWVVADEGCGALWTCQVDQGHYGHFSRKPTWLLAHDSCRLPQLIWGPSPQRVHPRALELHGYKKARRIGMVAMVGGKDKTRIREATPPAFRDVLLGMARSALVHRTNEMDRRGLLPMDDETDLPQALRVRGRDDGSRLKAWTEEPPMGAEERRRIDGACCIAEPSLAVMLGMDPATMDPSVLEHARYLRDAARVRVRRIVAALNGVGEDRIPCDGGRPNWREAVVLPRDMWDRVKAALLTEAVADALGDEGAALLGEIGLW